MISVDERVTKFTFKFQRRSEPNRLWQVLSIPVALGAALALSSILIHATGADIAQALAAMFQGAFGDRNALLETLVQATPLVFTGLAATVAFRARIWNIGGEGQLVAGALAAYLASATFSGLPRIALIPTVLFSAILGGALWGMIPGYLKVRFGADEIIVTVLLNYVIQYLQSFLLSGPWRDPTAFFIQTRRLPEVVRLPILFEGSRLHLGFVIALMVAIVVYVLLWKTPLGYEIRALGYRPNVARHKGIDVAKTILLVMAISGAIAGLAGGSELFGIHQRLRIEALVGFGFTGILVALLGRLHPAGVVLAAVLFGALVNGSSRMQIVTGVPVALVYAIQSVVILFLMAADGLSRYQLRR